MSDWAPLIDQFSPYPPLPPRLAKYRFCDMCITEQWLLGLSKTEPMTPGFLRVPFTFFSDAKGIDAKPMLKGRTHAYAKGNTWFVSGTQLLGASGWQPDCTVANHINIKRILPPICSPTSPIKISDPEVILH